MRQAGLTANLKKCVIGWREVRYLGYHLGGGQVHQQLSKTDAVAACPQPKTKKQVRAFLGMASYYRQFIPTFTELTSPPTSPVRVPQIRSSGPSIVRWRLRNSTKPGHRGDVGVAGQLVIQYHAKVPCSGCRGDFDVLNGDKSESSLSLV